MIRFADWLESAILHWQLCAPAGRQVDDAATKSAKILNRRIWKVIRVSQYMFDVSETDDVLVYQGAEALGQLSM